MRLFLVALVGVAAISPARAAQGINVSLPVSGVLTNACNGQVDFVNGDIVNISNELETFCR